MNANSQIKFKTLMLRSSLCNYRDAYILVAGTITITGIGTDDAARRLDERYKGIIFKNCASFTDCISEINRNQIDNAKYIDVVMPMHNLILNIAIIIQKHQKVCDNITEMTQKIIQRNLNHSSTRLI